MANVTEAEVRGRCQWHADEVSDALLATAAFLPAGDAWLDKKLAAAGLSFSGFDEDSTDQVLAKSAEIAAVAAVVASRAVQGDIKTGLLTVKDTDQAKLLSLAEELRNESKYFLSLLGVGTEGSFYFSRSGGADYSPNAEDNTNIDMATADSDEPFGIWP